MEVLELRAALGDDARSPRCIETVHRERAARGIQGLAQSGHLLGKSERRLRATVLDPNLLRHRLERGELLLLPCDDEAAVGTRSQGRGVCLHVVESGFGAEKVAPPSTLARSGGASLRSPTSGCAAPSP
jgi:hypothetical protein